MGFRATADVRACKRIADTIALGLKLAFVILAAAGMATLWMAVLADTGASLLVVANGLRGTGLLTGQRINRLLIGR